MAYRGILNSQRRNVMGERVKAKIDVAVESKCTSDVRAHKLAYWGTSMICFTILLPRMPEC